MRSVIFRFAFENLKFKCRRAPRARAISEPSSVWYLSIIIFLSTKMYHWNMNYESMHLNKVFFRNKWNCLVRPKCWACNESLWSGEMSCPIEKRRLPNLKWIIHIHRLVWPFEIQLLKMFYLNSKVSATCGNFNDRNRVRVGQRQPYQLWTGQTRNFRQWEMWRWMNNICSDFRLFKNKIIQ